jgi:hypothetical protein
MSKIEWFKVGKKYYFPHGSEMPPKEFIGEVIVTNINQDTKTITVDTLIHKVDQHCSLSECGKTTHKDNRSPVWKNVNCKDCLRVRKPYGRRKW